jgi:MFS family permease
MICSTFALLTDYGKCCAHRGFFSFLTSPIVLLVPLAYTIGERYNIKNEALIGACFIPCGVGNFIGAPLAGRISDQIIIKWKKRRNGIWVPEDRLRGTMIGAFLFVPVSVLASGLVTTYVDGTVGLVANLVCLFFNGIGVDLVLSPTASYVVDILHDRSAEGMAANSAARNLLLSSCIAAILPLIKSIGVVWVNAISAVGAWFGACLLLFTIRYGAEMRAWVDIGYTTSEENN